MTTHNKIPKKLKNDSRVGVRNGTRGKITSIDDFGNISFLTDSGKKISFNANFYNAFNLGYALTINKLQGATVQKIICNAPSNSHFDRNKFYVTVSRAKLHASIFTNDKQKLQEDAKAWCHKVTSDDFIHDLQEKIAENKSRVVHSNYISKHQRALHLRKNFFRLNLFSKIEIVRRRTFWQKKIAPSALSFFYFYFSFTNLYLCIKIF